MLRRCTLLLGATAVNNPHRVLGVDPGTSFEDVRARFHYLTQKYHPDKPGGDEAKFREINAAYRILRAEYRKSRESAEHAAFSGRKVPTGSKEFWEERNNKIRAEQERIRRKQQEMREERDRKVEHRRGLKAEVMTFFNGYEILLSMCTVLVVLIYSVERYYTVNHTLTLKNDRIKRMDEGLPPPMPLEEDIGFKDKYRDPPKKRELSQDTERIRRESFHRRATQRKFDDFREFIFVMDPDGVANRKVATSRFSFQYLNEKEIPKKCPIVMEINSDERLQSYEAVESKLLEKVENTPWANPDVGYAASIVVKGLSRIAANSPATTKWTFVEYIDYENGKKSATPMCVAAIHNNRFEEVGMCQRVSITGKPGLRPDLVKKRMEDLNSGKLNKKSLVKGGYLNVKELSTPLKDMAL